MRHKNISVKIFRKNWPINNYETQKFSFEIIKNKKKFAGQLWKSQKKKKISCFNNIDYGKFLCCWIAIKNDITGTGYHSLIYSE